jgi:WD40 repeat protein
VFSADGKQLISGGGELQSRGQVQVWDAESGRRLREVELPHGVRQLVLSPDGTRLAGVVAADGGCRVWAQATMAELLNLRQEGVYLWSAAFSPDGGQLLTGGADQKIRVWDSATGDLLHTLRGHNSDVNCLCFEPHGKRLVSTGYDQMVKLWDPVTWQEVLTLRGHDAPVWALAFSPDGHRVYTASADQSIRVWNAAPRAE